MKRVALTSAAVLAAVCAAAQTTDRSKCDAPSEHSVIEQCGWDENGRLEAQLKGSYATLVEVLKSKRTDSQNLATSHEAWLMYRDTSCSFWGNRVQYQVPWCRASLTSARIKELVHMHECEQEGGGKC